MRWLLQFPVEIKRAWAGSMRRARLPKWVQGNKENGFDYLVVLTAERPIVCKPGGYINKTLEQKQMPKHLSQIRKSSKRWAAGVLARQAERMINTTAPENVKTGQDLIELALILYPDHILRTSGECPGAQYSQAGGVMQGNEQTSITGTCGMPGCGNPAAQYTENPHGDHMHLCVICAAKPRMMKTCPVCQGCKKAWPERVSPYFIMMLHNEESPDCCRCNGTLGRLGIVLVISFINPDVS